MVIPVSVGLVMDNVSMSAPFVLAAGTQFTLALFVFSSQVMGDGSRNKTNVSNEMKRK